ncbi:FAD-dependent monooxygenase [Actinomadura rifamycini]|uniref:FAD-dependent monooxygenase n=1 Tax=Actinomadura rifamycini TaxID=31962 RepID=UPI000554CC9E|nr:FAD-dependent monooxygenase [Actinomadura rifamycini]
MDAQERTSVLIVGGGLVGLAMSAFLARLGVPALLVERRSGPSPHPRARGVNPRTMELLRLLGIADRVRDAESARALAGNHGIVAVETLAGRRLGELAEPYFRGVRDPAGLSPESWCMVHQDELEPLLRDRAVELGAAHRFGTEYVGHTETDGGVVATVRDTASGRTAAVAADRLVAADGAGGGIRERLGIGTHGPGALARFVNIAFTADLTGPLDGRRFIMCYTTGTGTRSALLPVNNTDRWMLHVLRDADDASLPGPDECAALVRAAAGVPDLPVRVDGVLPWVSAGRVADAFAAGRAFLVGDAAHVMPPSGAFGANVGVQDAHALAWRLAAVARGDAGPALLDGYDAERRPAADHAMRQAVLRSRDRPRFVGGGDAPPPDPDLEPDENVVFGPEPDGTPGRRAPHVVLPGGTSTIHRYGTRFVLGHGPAGDGWGRAAAAAAADAGIGVDAYGGDDAWCAAHGVARDGAVLVRPDGVVAWRAATGPDDPGALAGALRGALAAPVPGAAR